jgi:EAL domain-containing protein (putative c-di-GMP-specific phosphodiesterase class I)/CHASE2 domain-containing sensor protein
MAGEKSFLSMHRAKHLGIALAIAALIGILGIFGPANGLLWAAASRALQHQASREIVFIGAPSNLSQSDDSQLRAGLADIIDRLSAAGARKIFVDINLEQPGSARDDAALNRAARQSRRTAFVDRYATRGASARLVSPPPSVAQGVPSVVRMEWVDQFGYTWTSPYSVTIEGQTYPSFPAALAGRTGRPGKEFYIDYSTSYSSIPSYTTAEARQLLADPSQARTFSGKKIVIGTLPSRGGAFASIPGFPVVAESYTGIFGAETLIHGPLRHIAWYVPLLLAAAILALACRARRASGRRFAYAVAASILPVLLAASVWIGLAVDFCELGTFFLAYGALRLWDQLHRRVPLVNSLSGLPTFERLERDLVRARGSRQALVVAKVHRFDDVLASLPRAKHGEYMQLLASRLRVVDEDLPVYSNGGSNFAWLQEFISLEQLRSHLIGMRAIFANALRIDDLSVDVGITFGAETSEDTSAAKRISSALAAADRTTEAGHPVILANHASDEERRWNISLQARLDEAMKSGEIYLAYQPQFDLETGAMFGVEALARWDDPERGEIPPSYFIEQCEQVGRMHALTKKVFEAALGEFSASPLAGADFNLSMNVSATMLNDFEVVRLLEEGLAASRMAPKNVTIEMTETARIADLRTAALVMAQIKRLGVRLSADDFGVGAASFEPFLQLPFDELKIDRLFVSRIERDQKARKIVEHLVKLGRDLDILVLAEGVEDQATFEVVRALGCPAAQGYKLGRPTALENVYHAWLASRSPERATGAV